jgi:uncharacterized protein
MSVSPMPVKYNQGISKYKVTLAFFFSAMILFLLMVVDIRRGFIFLSSSSYFYTSPYINLNGIQLLLILLSIIFLVVAFKTLDKQETELSEVNMEGIVKFSAFLIFGILIIDLFTYRGVPAFRIADSGNIGAGWLDAWGVTGWAQPIALAASYMVTVWHATFIGVLLAALSLTILPKYLVKFFTKTGFGGSLFGATYALPQPFCSCCASVVTPSLKKHGASQNFMLAFVVGSPMLNITGLVLAAILLPTPYAIIRIVGGILLTVPVTYGISKVAQKWDLTEAPKTDNWFTRFINMLAGKYCELFHLDEIVEGRPVDTPVSFLKTYGQAAYRLAMLLIPTLFIWSVLSSYFFQLLPSTFGNNFSSVLFSAIAGTFFMISTWTEIPVAMQMINAGFSAPAATMLLVLPPVSLPCLMILGGAIGKFRVVALLSIAVMFAGIVAGIIFLV